MTPDQFLIIWMVVLIVLFPKNRQIFSKIITATDTHVITKEGECMFILEALVKTSL